jgi:tetratricopeptide (TPR) repeat protein
LLRAQGKYAEAEKECRQGLELRQKMADDFPGAPKYRAELATSYTVLSQVLHSRRRYADAEAACRQALALRQALAERFPAVAEYRHQLAINYNNLGLQLAELGKREEAQAAYRQALELLEKVVRECPALPEYRRELAHTHNNQANLLWVQRKYPEAEAACRQALDLRKKLVDDFSGPPGYRRELADSYNTLFRVLGSAGKLAEAETACRQALALREKLAADFGAVPDYRHDLAVSHNNLGFLLFDLKKYAEAEQAYAHALALHEKLVAEVGAVPAYRRELARTYNNRAKLFGTQRKYAEADAAYRQALDLRKVLADKYPKVPDYRQELAATQLGLRDLHWGWANALDNLKRHAEAVPHWDQAFELSSPADRLLVRARRATSRAKAGQAAEALADVEALTGDAARLPTPPPYRQPLAACYVELGIALSDIHRPKEAEAVHRKALAIQEQLVADSPKVPDYQNGLAGTLVNLAIGHHERREFAAAVKLLEEARPHHLAALKVNPKHPAYREFYRNNLRVLADCRLRLADHARLAATADEVARFGSNPANDAYAAARFLGHCVTLADKDAQLDEAKRKELAKSYADGALAQLRQAVAHGYKDAARMKREPALEPLRAREEFRKLVADLEGKPKE